MESQPLKVASYNIRKAVGLDWRRDPHRIVGVLNQIEADVVALQEADRRLGPRAAAIPRELIEAETDLEIVPLAKNDVSLGWHGNAILVRKGLRTGRIDHIEMPGLEPRGAVSAEILTEDGPLTIVGVHLGLRRRCRAAQIATIRQHLRRSDEARSVVLGDYNEWSRQWGMSGFGDAFDIVSPGRSFHASRPVACLDRVAIGRAFELSDAGVEERGAAPVASDHLPIWASISNACKPQ